VPTYNFAVVVDDWDMGITHVFRGDEHINNTPWQINIFRALGAPLPLFGHCPIILGDDGQKLSKRRGAVSVTAYEEAGYLPEAMLNYLARLGWSHGDDELFSREQMVQWFDGSHLARARRSGTRPSWPGSTRTTSSRPTMRGWPRWCSAQLAARRAGGEPRGWRACALFKDRCATLVELADWVEMLFGAGAAVGRRPRDPCDADAVRPALQALRERLAEVDWDKAGDRRGDEGRARRARLKMPQLAPALRVLVCGRAQTPSIDAVLALFDATRCCSACGGLKNLSGYTHGLA
jgi:glutamyl-tRNA synthetase